ncbi:MAG: NAD(P)-binding domain-containing protein, partial [candidate division WOR-3 bacterium]
MKKKITIIGDGAWGTALAIMLARNKHKISLWSPFPKYAEKIEKYRENKDFLPGFKLPENIFITSDPQLAMSSADAVVIAVPTKYINKTLDTFNKHIPPDTKIISVSKGFDSETKLRLSELIKQKL